MSQRCSGSANAQMPRNAANDKSVRSSRSNHGAVGSSEPPGVQCCAARRLAFVCWRALEENPLDILPLRAASTHLPPQPAHDPDAPGPFAFANPDRVRGILEEAGFGDIEIAAHDEQVGSGDLDAMLAVCSRVGALGKILRENPELRAAALPAVRSALAAHDGPDGVRLTAATWIVTARVPA